MIKLIDYIKEELATPMNTLGMGEVHPNGFCLLKPGFIKHNDEFKNKLTDNGWKILKDGECTLSDVQAKDLYAPHKDKDFYGDLCSYMVSAPCHWYSCYKDCEDPIKDMNKIKDEIRKAWGEDDMKNAMHSSDSIDNVNREYMICDCKE